MFWEFLLYLFSPLIEPDWGKNTLELCAIYHYKVEQHTVTTEDGFILTLYRILGRIGDPYTGSKTPLIIQPGIASSSDIVLIASPPYAPALFFSDLHYDVWIVNPRGNRYSHSHVNFTAADPRFWNYTFHEMSIYDHKAYIDFILNHTGYSKAHFMGHSQGGTQILIAMSMFPNYYAERIISAVLIAPVVRMEVIRSLPLEIFHYTQILAIQEKMGLHEFMPFNYVTSMLNAVIFKLLPPLRNLLLTIFCDSFPEEMNVERAPAFMTTYPTGSSMKSMRHILQIHESGGLHQWRENKSEKLVDYYFSRIPDGIPIGVFGGWGDRMASPESLVWFDKFMMGLNKKIMTNIYPKLGHLGLLIPAKGNTQHLVDIDTFMKAAMIGI